MKRTAKVSRKTKETDINVEINIENQIGIINKIASGLIKKENPSDIEQNSRNFF